MFSRRSFLRLSPGPAALVVAPLAIGSTEKPTDELRWRDKSGDLWDFRWSGWQLQPAQDMFAGIWYGYPILADGKPDEARMCAHAAFPGVTGVHRPWDMINTAIYMSEGQSPVNHRTPQSEKNSICVDTLKYLLKYIDEEVAGFDWADFWANRPWTDYPKERITLSASA